MTTSAPVTDIKIPAACIRVSFSLNKMADKMVMKMGGVGGHDDRGASGADGTQPFEEEDVVAKDAGHA